MSQSGFSNSRVLVLLVTVVAVIVPLCSYVLQPEDAEELQRRASLLFARGDREEARKMAIRAVKVERLPAALLLLAQINFDEEKFLEALNYLSFIDDSSPDWVGARRTAATIYHQKLFQLAKAESAYRDVLSVEPDDVEANEQYARLLGVCGRREDAVPHVIRLIRAGQDTDLLMLISRETGALSDEEMLIRAREADPSDANPLMGQAMAETLNLNPQAALQILREARLLENVPSLFYGQIGRLLLVNEQHEDLALWAEQLTDDRMSAEAWFVRAELAKRAGDPEGAIRCYWEGLKLRPETPAAMNQLARLLSAEGRDSQASRFFQRVRRLNELRNQQRLAIMSEQQPDFEDVVAMVKGYYEVGRFWEVLGWGALASEARPDHSELRALLHEVAEQAADLPLRLTVNDANPAWQVDLSEYPIPQASVARTATPSGEKSTDISFKLQRKEVGFDFQFFRGSRQTTNRMYEFGGGGLGVLDFDNDTAPDLYCSQGQHVGDKPAASELFHDELFRNRRGETLTRVSDVAGLNQALGFGQGVAVGDFNNDGFQDLYVATTSANQLWVNNGDGTFQDATSAMVDLPSEWTTSCLMADLNGDTFPDFYDVNYLAGDDVFERLCVEDHGDPIQCSPFDFDAAVDRVWLSDGQGGFVHDEVFLSPPPAGKGLGVIGMNLGDSRLSLFVANDTVANFFYVADSPTADSMQEIGTTAGLAFNGEGRAEACMGIAAADCNHDGLMDLLITNFLHESNTLYTSLGPRVFQDSTRELGLHESSLPVLGWGTQFLDTNLDGRLELFVANGYPQDLTRYGTPYAMVPHVFEYTGNCFQRLPTGQLGDWSREEFVGRSVARFDWNKDQKPDVCVGLLDAPSFVLTNTSDTSSCFLELDLIAQSTARDATGVVVEFTIDGVVFAHQRTAGDGYQCSNQRQLLMGCGQAEVLDEVRITWPSGRLQVLRDVPTSSSFLVIEGRRPLAVPR